MSIATKLEKLTTDITSAYTSIENKGGTIPSDKNTDNLHTAIDSIEVIEQATAEGESISLANTKAMPYKDYVVEGKSEQETRSGKNLANSLNLTEQEINGVTFTPVYENNALQYININGKATARADYKFVNYVTYNANLYDIQKGNDNAHITVMLVARSGSVVDSTTSSKHSFNLSQNKDCLVWIRIYNDGYTINNQKIYPQVKLSSITDDTYEPYGASPSPDYPSETHSVADDVNLFDVESISSGNGDVSYEINNNHLIMTATGTIGAQYIKNFVKNVDSSKSYTLSFKTKKIVKETDKGSKVSILVYGSNDDSTYTALVNIAEDNPVEGQEYSFNNTVKGYNYYRFFIYNNASTLVTVGEKTEYWDIKFQEGSIATPYSPYNQGTVTIKQRGKNLFDASKIDNASIVVTDNGKTITMPIVSSGNGNTNTSSILSDLCPNLQVGDIIYVRFERNLNDNRNRFIYLYGSNKSLYGYDDSASYTITQEDLNSYVFLYGNDYSFGETQQCILTDFRIVKNSTDEWEQYKSNDFIIQTSPLRSLPNGVKDTIELQDMQNHTRIGRQTGTLTETTTITLSDAKSNGAYMCNIKPSGTLTGKTIELEAGDYEIIYELAEEIIEPLTHNQATTMLDITHTGSYEGTTNIYTDEDVKPTIGVGYYKKG